MAYNYETQFTSQNFTAARDAVRIFGMARVIEGITLHWWGDPAGNPSYEGVRNYLLANSSNTSAHIVTSGTGRRAACIVDYGDIAHHAGSAWGNARTIGVELDPRNRPEDRDIVAEVIADIRSAFGDVPLYWHSYFTATACPGVYKAIIEEIDQLSYTKYSHPTEWGKGGDIIPKAPVTPPAPAQTPSTTPQPVLFKVFDDNGEQIGTYSIEANAFKKFVDNGSDGKITQGSEDVTASLLAKYTTPSPTTQVPDTGLPVTEKYDYSEENNTLLKENKNILNKILAIAEQLLAAFLKLWKI